MLKMRLVTKDGLAEEALVPALVPDSPIAPRQRRPYSQAYFCPRCGEVWAQRIIEGGGDFEIRRRHCFEHGSGLLHEGVFDNLLDYWPTQALRRELTILHHHLSRSTHPMPDAYHRLVYTWSLS